MKRYLKIFLIGVLITIVLFVMAFAIGKWYIHTHKEEIIGKIKNTAKEKYYSIVSINDLDLTFFSTFPYLALQLNDVDVQGPMYHIHHHKLFSAKKIDLRIKPAKLFLGKIEFGKTALSKGNFYIYTDTSGVSNLSYFNAEKEKAKKNNKSLTLPDNIELNDFEFAILDLHKEKHYEFLIHRLAANTNGKEIEIIKDITIKSLAFNAPRGSFVANKRISGKYKIQFDQEKSRLTFTNINMLIDKHPFQFTGDFQLNSAAHFSLQIITKQISYDFAKSLLVPHITKALSAIEISAPLDVDTKLDGPLNGGDPLVVAKWNVKNATVTTKLLAVKNAGFSGVYTNEVVKGVSRKDPNSKIEITDLSANWEGIPIISKKITVKDLSKPKVIGGFSSSFNLSAFNSVVQSESFDFSDGEGKLHILYNGPLDSINKKNASIDIGLQLLKGTIAIHPLNLLITECQTDIAIRNADIFIKQLSAKASDGSKLSITGTSTNTFALIDDNPGKVLTNINIYSPYLNLTDISRLLRGNRKNKKAKSKNRLGKSIEKIDQMLEKETILLSVKADKIKHHNLNATNFITTAKLNQGAWLVETLSLQMAGGFIKLNASVDNASGNKHRLKSTFLVKGIDASALLYAFDDFGLKGISHKNITGKIDIAGKAETHTDKFGNIDKKNLIGDLRFSLKNGSLKNIKALEEIGDKYLKKRNLSDLRFAEINNTVTLSQGIIAVPRMQIESSAFRLFVEGQYGIAGPTDLRIQVPLSNLSAQDAGYVPKKTKKNARGGMSIYLRAKSGDDGKIGIGLDLIGAVRKSNVSKKS